MEIVSMEMLLSIQLKLAVAVLLSLHGWTSLQIVIAPETCRESDIPNLAIWQEGTGH